MSGSADCTLRTWDAETGNELRCVRGHEREVASVAWCPNGHRIVSGSWDCTVRVWDAKSGNELRCVRGHEREVTSVAWSPDGHRIVSGSWDRTVRVWDAKSGNELRCVRGHERHVASVSYSRDGRWIVSREIQNLNAPLLGAAGVQFRLAESAVHVWDAETGEELEVIGGEADPGTIVATVSGLTCRALPYMETVVEDSASGVPIAWFPEGLRCVTSHPVRPAWAAAAPRRLGPRTTIHPSIGDELVIIVLEGMIHSMPMALEKGGAEVEMERPACRHQDLNA